MQTYRKKGAKGSGRQKKSKLTQYHLLPLVVVAVILTFSLVFTIFLLPLISVTSEADVRSLFTVLLIFSATVSSAVTLVFYLILSKKFK